MKSNRKPPCNRYIGAYGLHNQIVKLLLKSHLAHR
nr:MAG TPA: hypothetical protein [Caudoviricetes sp.]